MIPPYTRVKVTGKTLAGSEQWKGASGIVIPEKPPFTHRVNFYADKDGKPVLRGGAMFVEKSLAIEDPKERDIVLIPAIYVKRIGSSENCIVTPIVANMKPGTTLEPITVPLKHVCPVDPKE